MRIESPDPKPRDSGDYYVHVSPGYGKPTADIHLDEDGELRLLWLDEGDCERLIRAAAESLEQLRAYAAQIAAPHGRRRIYKGTCQLCGKPDDDELHAEADPPAEVLATMEARGMTELTAPDRFTTLIEVVDCTARHPSLGVGCEGHNADGDHVAPGLEPGDPEITWPADPEPPAFVTEISGVPVSAAFGLVAQ